MIEIERENKNRYIEKEETPPLTRLCEESFALREGGGGKFGYRLITDKKTRKEEREKKEKREKKNRE